MTTSPRSPAASKVTESEIKAALSALERPGREHLRLRNGELSDAQARRREAEKALTAQLKKTGFDFAAHDSSGAFDVRCPEVALAILT